MAVSTYLSIITLNVNGLNAPIKRHRVVDWMKKKTSQYAACNSLQGESHTQPDGEEMEKDISHK